MQRTSTTWFHRYSAVPELMAKASALVGIAFEECRWEEAQTVRAVGSKPREGREGITRLAATFLLFD